MGNKHGKEKKGEDSALEAQGRVRVENLQGRLNAQLASEDLPSPPPGNEYMQLHLVPHQHTLFCERKQRVCSAMGKLMELETLQLCGEESFPLQSVVWTKRLMAGSASGTAAASSSAGCSAEQSQSQGELITPSGSDNRTYRLTKGDVGYTISASIHWVDDKGAPHMRTVECGLGPVLPGPARLLDLHIEGTPQPGQTLVAVSQYIGGSEGASEYWWLRVRNGKREQLGEPRSLVEGLDDPRALLVREEDEGCVFKVKCLPVRSDGYRGEIVTSKACGVVESEASRRRGVEVDEVADALVIEALRAASCEVTAEASAPRQETPVLEALSSEESIEGAAKDVVEGGDKVTDECPIATAALPLPALIPMESTRFDSCKCTPPPSRASVMGLAEELGVGAGWAREAAPVGDGSGAAAVQAALDAVLETTEGNI